MTSLIQHFEADFLWKVSLKILKTFTHVDHPKYQKEESISIQRVSEIRPVMTKASYTKYYLVI